MLARQQRRKDSKFRKPDIPAIVLTDPVISQQNLPSPLAAYSTPAVDTNSKYSKSDFPEIALPDPVISQQNLPSPLAAYSRPAVDTESIAAHSKTAIDESPSSTATKLKDETSRKSVSSRSYIFQYLLFCAEVMVRLKNNEFPME